MPGLLGLVTFRDDPNWHHERLFLYPVTPRRWVVLTADGDLYDEELAWYSSAEELTRAGYPPAVTNVVAFEETLSDSDVLAFIKDGRAEARRLRMVEGIRGPEEEPRVWVGWDGFRRELVEDNMMDSLRRRLRMKTAESRRVAHPDATDLPSTDVLVRVGSPRETATVAGDRLWVACDPGHPAFGESRRPDASDPAGPYAMLDYFGERIPWRLVETREVPEYYQQCSQGMRARGAAGPEETAERADPAAEPAAPAPTGPVATLRERLRESSDDKVDGEQDDLRTLAVDFDEHGLRWKPWREVVGEMTQGQFDDWSKHLPEGSPISRDMLMNFERIGGDPRRWLQEWLRDRGLGSRERTAIEMRVLVDAVYLAGCYDQLNLPSLLFVEVLLRRAAQIIEAYDGDPSRPNWAGVRYMMGETHALNPVPFQMKAFNARKLKEEAEIENARKKAPPPSGGADPAHAASDEAGVETGAGGGSAGKKSKRTRKLGAAAEG